MYGCQNQLFLKKPYKIIMFFNVGQNAEFDKNLYFLSLLARMSEKLREGFKKKRQIIHILWIRGGGHRMWISIELMIFNFVNENIYDSGSSVTYSRVEKLKICL